MQATLDFEAFNDDADDDAGLRKKTTLALVREIKREGTDYEWYPTDDAQIAAIKADIQSLCREARHYHDDMDIRLSLLDCGAGDGRLLTGITSGKRYAIEKNMRLVEAMDSSIMVVGTDFQNQSLLDKKVDVITCNPPYSEFEAWAQKIILEGNCAYVYLIMPVRWENSQPIKEALALRAAETKVIGEFDYLSADRVARARVHIVRVQLGSFGYRGGESHCERDPFDVWFDEAFPLNAPETEVSKWTKEREREEALAQQLSEGGELVRREGLVRLLDQLYQRDLNQLMETYQAMSKIPGELLVELDINIKNVKSALKLKVQGLKDLYWKKLFDSLNQITDKLCHSSRSKLLDKLTSHTHVDFSEANAVAVVLWVLKHANNYYDEQVIETFETMTEAANVVNYKSNERVIKNDGWRYCSDKASTFGPYGLDYRILLERVGGWVNPGCWSQRSRNGISERAAVLLGDLVTLANNIGFDASGNLMPHERTWLPGKPQQFYFYDHSRGEKVVLFEAKVFKNGNTHLRLHERFIQKLNVVHGRLKGWLRSAAEAAEEMDVPLEVAEPAFAVQLKLTVSDIPLLCSH